MNLNWYPSSSLSCCGSSTLRLSDAHARTHIKHLDKQRFYLCFHRLHTHKGEEDLFVSNQREPGKTYTNAISGDEARGALDADAEGEGGRDGWSRVSCAAII